MPNHVTHKCTIKDNVITLKFPEIPPLESRNLLKKYGFVYNGSTQQWTAPATTERVDLIQPSAQQSFTNTVITGSCVEVMQNLPDSSIDLILTDPPYLINYRDRTGRTIRNDKNSDWIEPAFEGLHRVLKDNSYCVVFCALPSLVPFITALEKAGFRHLGQIIWHKNYASSSHHLAFHHEQALVIAKGYPTKPVSPLKSVQDWKYTGNKLHPTQKHVDILLPLIESFSGEGDIVLDPFCGSGSTLEAAARSSRSYCGIELDDDYAKVAKDRLLRMS